LPNSFVGQSANLHGRFSKKISLQVYLFSSVLKARGFSIFLFGWMGVGYLPRYVSKYIKIRFAKSDNNNIQFGDNCIEQRRLPGILLQGILKGEVSLYH